MTGGPGTCSRLGHMREGRGGGLQCGGVAAAPPTVPCGVRTRHAAACPTHNRARKRGAPRRAKPEEANGFMHARRPRSHAELVLQQQLLLEARILPAQFLNRGPAWHGAAQFSAQRLGGCRACWRQLPPLHPLRLPAGCACAPPMPRAGQPSLPPTAASPRPTCGRACLPGRRRRRSPRRRARASCCPRAPLAGLRARAGADRRHVAWCSRPALGAGALRSSWARGAAGSAVAAHARAAQQSARRVARCARFCHTHPRSAPCPGVSDAFISVRGSAEAALTPGETVVSTADGQNPGCAPTPLA